MPLEKWNKAQGKEGLDSKCVLTRSQEGLQGKVRGRPGEEGEGCFQWENIKPGALKQEWAPHSKQMCYT